MPDDPHPPADEPVRRPIAAAVAAALARLTTPDHRAVIERADRAVDDLAAAADFADDGGVDALAEAVDHAETPAVRDRGERALAAFQRFHRAATDPAAATTRSPDRAGRDDGDALADDGRSADRQLSDHFRRGRGGILRRDAERSSR